jgi:hypothetical protein
MRCETCQKSTKEYLIYEVIPRKLIGFDWPNVKTMPYCHEHLIAEFKKRLLNFHARLAIFDPNLEAVGQYAYAFIPMDRMRETKTDLTLIDDHLQAVNTATCSRCSNPARSAFFGKHTFPRNKKGDIDIIRWNKPIAPQITGSPEYLCLECAAREIVPAISDYKSFSSGLCAPYRGDGIMVSLMV